MTKLTNSGTSLSGVDLHGLLRGCDGHYWRLSLVLEGNDNYDQEHNPFRTALCDGILAQLVVLKYDKAHAREEP